MRKHAKYIHAWANGDEIEYRQKGSLNWIHTEQPMWDDTTEYRIKPEPEMTHFQRFTLYTNANEHRFDKLKGIVTVHPQYIVVGEILVRYVNDKAVEICNTNISEENL